MNFKRVPIYFTQAYIHTNLKLKRKVFIPYFQEFSLNVYKFFHLLKLFYRLIEGEDYWDRNLKNHIMTNLEITTIPLNQHFTCVEITKLLNFLQRLLTTVYMFWQKLTARYVRK